MRARGRRRQFASRRAPSSSAAAAVRRRRCDATTTPVQAVAATAGPRDGDVRGDGARRVTGGGTYRALVITACVGAGARRSARWPLHCEIGGSFAREPVDLCSLVSDLAASLGAEEAAEESDSLGDDDHSANHSARSNPAFSRALAVVRDARAESVAPDAPLGRDATRRGPVGVRARRRRALCARLAASRRPSTASGHLADVRGGGGRRGSAGTRTGGRARPRGDARDGPGAAARLQLALTLRARRPRSQPPANSRDAVD